MPIFYLNKTDNVYSKRIIQIFYLNKIDNDNYSNRIIQMFCLNKINNEISLLIIMFILRLLSFYHFFVYLSCLSIFKNC